MRIVIAGGGYAGLACLTELSRRIGDAELILVDPGEAHLKITHLHETVRKPLQRFRKSFAELGERIGFEHHRGTVVGELTDMDQQSAIVVGDQRIDFDYLVIATGATPPALPKSRHVYDRDDLRQQDASEILAAFREDKARPRVINVIGGGPSGLQMLFELESLFTTDKQPVQLRLIDREPTLLQEYPDKIAAYVLDKLSDMGIDYLPQTEYLACDNNTIELRNVSTDVTSAMPSGLCFLFPGVSARPFSVQVDRYGRLDGSGKIFSAGDCSQYNSRGDDMLTAQVAVRQGKLVAQNIDRLSRNVRPIEYFFRELGYVISLGPGDAVGWMLLKDKVVSGLPAFAIKELVEAQYDLFVSGIDTYVV